MKHLPSVIKVHLIHTSINKARAFQNVYHEKFFRRFSAINSDEKQRKKFSRHLQPLGIYVFVFTFSLFLLLRRLNMSLNQKRVKWLKNEGMCKPAFLYIYYISIKAISKAFEVFFQTKLSCYFFMLEEDTKPIKIN